MPSPKRNCFARMSLPIGSMYAIYGNIYHQYTLNVSIYNIHGSYGVETYLRHLGEMKIHLPGHQGFDP